MLQNNNFDLQIIPGSIPPVLHLSQYDSGRQFTATLKNGSATYSVASGATAKIKGFNAAGVAWEQEATISGSTVIFSPSGAATDQFGVMPVTIEITVSDEVITPLLVVFDVQKAGYTNEEAVRSPEFETALEAAVAAAIEEGGIGFTDEFKQALLACFAHVWWADEHGQDYYDALEAALYPAVHLVSIAADYQQDHPIYDTDSLDAIKVSDDLTVTANYSDGSSEVLDDDDYELSGTLTEGTSTITVSYGGKTTTISVVVTHVPTLDDIAYGELTYRDIFITANLVKSIGDWEASDISLGSSWVTASDGSTYRIYAGTPSVSTAAANSPTHSLKAFGTTSQQAALFSTAGQSGKSYIVACSVKVDRYSTGGGAGVSVTTPEVSPSMTKNLLKNQTTSGWVQMVDTCTFTSNKMQIYIGTISAANVDGYVDDVVVTPLPDGMTVAQATTLYAEYINILKGVTA